MAPAATDEPGRQVQRTRPGRVELPGYRDHVVPIVSVCQPHLHTEIPRQDLDHHGCLLLPDPRGVVEAMLKIVGGGVIGPDRRRVTAGKVYDAPGGS